MIVPRFGTGSDGSRGSRASGTISCLCLRTLGWGRGWRSTGRRMRPTVEALWRYPVKSLRGEQLAQVEVGLDGVAGDRLVHVRQPSGRVVTSRYRPALLGLQATLDVDGEPLIEHRSWRD